MLNFGDKIGIVCCSNPQKRNSAEKVRHLEQTLLSMGLYPIASPCIYEDEESSIISAQRRALALMDFYRDDEIKGIFDISGGDLANGILNLLDYDLIADTKKMFWGYSDLTTIINAIYTKTGKSSVLYQIRNLIYDHGEEQETAFIDTVLKGKNTLFDIDYSFVQKHEMHGIVVGGNIRCLLKLAGTQYMPSFEDRILLLESYSGTIEKMETYLSQLQQLGAFHSVAGILLGTFTQMQEEACTPTIEGLVKNIVGPEVPIAVTKDIGHGTDSKGIIIGQEL